MNCRLFLVGVALSGLLTVLVAGGAVAEDLSANRRELVELQQQIESTMRDLNAKRAQAGNLSADLERLEKSLARIRELTRRSDQELTRLDRQQAERQQALDTLRRQQKETERQLRKRMVALYKVGEVGMVRAMLSSAATPLELAEKYAFLSRIARHDRQVMAEYRRLAAEEEQALAELQQLRAEQSAVAAQRREQQATLNEATAAQKQLLSGVRSDAARLAADLEELRARAARLADLVKKLESAQRQSYTGKSADFSAQKGHLPWPVAGPVRIGFGINRHPELGTLIESNGLEIVVPPQSPIRAVWAGRVIFAGPLKGFGNLMVIDHGDKYYSLYAHAASFTRKVGDIVGPEDVVARSGHEGRDAVYFEIRYRSEPVNPIGWLVTR